MEEYAKAALFCLREIIEDGRTTAADRIAAAEIILEYSLLVRRRPTVQ